MIDCEDLRQAINARDQFLAIASHELRTPLLTLAMVLHSLQKQIESAPPDLGGKLKRKLVVGHRQVDRLDRLVATLLDVTRITAESPMLDRQPCDVAKVIVEAVDRCRLEADRTATPLVVSVEDLHPRAR